MLTGKKVYVASPLSAPDQEGIECNMGLAQVYVHKLQKYYHCRAFASHAYLPLMLDDSIPEERALACHIGMELMGICDTLVVCGRKISAGMAAEIEEAVERGMDIYWYGSKEKPYGLRKVSDVRELMDKEG